MKLEEKKEIELTRKERALEAVATGLCFLMLLGFFLKVVFL